MPCVKYLYFIYEIFFDILSDRRKRRQFKRELTSYYSYSKTVDDFHPISTILKMKINVEKELQKKDAFNDKTADLIRLYLDLDSHLIKHAELFEKQLRTKSSDESILG